ncbi:MAG: phage holin family protein [Bacilli bacterium]|nr:phage holin family protein [Bacilli bacterium]
MKIIVVDNNKKARLNKVIDWLIYMVGYALILILASVLFESIEISNAFFGLFALIAAIIIYVLNKTIKPILFLLTLPLTGLTMGIFYPFLNVIILKMVDFILGKKFETNGVFHLFFIAILISIMNILLEIYVIRPITKRGVE